MSNPSAPRKAPRLRRENVEMVAAAVDEITDQHGLTKGEALYVLTSMLITTVEATEDTQLRDLFKDAVTASIMREAMTPLVNLIMRGNKDKHAAH